MGLEERIIFSSDELIRNVEKALDRLKALRYDPKYRERLGDGFCDRFLGWEEDIRRRKDEPFTIAVVGDFKRGKSTFINALLGREVLTTDVTTETVTLNYLGYGQESTQAVLEGGRRIRLQPEELKKEKLEAIIKEAGEPVEKLVLKRPCELLKDVTIVDTPGLGDTLKKFDDMVEQCLLQADAVIYMYFVMAPLSQTEQLFLKTAVLPQKFTSLFLVGNRADVLDSRESFEEMEEFLRERAAGVFPEGRNYVISALDELCRKLGKSRPNDELESVLEERFQELEQDILNVITEKKDFAVPDRMQRMFGAMLAEADQEFEALEASLSMSGTQAREAYQAMAGEREHQAEELAGARETLQSLMDDMSREAWGWMSDFLRRLEGQLGALGGVEAEDIQKHLSFYIADMLKEALNACLDFHRERLFDEMSDISGNLMKSLGRAQEDYSFRFELDNRMWTKGDNLGFGVSLVSQMGFLGNLAYLLGSGAAGALRSREIKNQKGELLKQVADQFPELRQSVKEALSQAYGRLKTAALEQLTEHYEEKIRKTEAQVELSMEISRKEEQEKEAIREVLAQTREMFREMRQLVMIAG